MKDLSTLIRLFEQYAYGQSYSDTFNSVLDYLLVIMKYFETDEQQSHALAIVEGIRNKDVLSSIFTEIGELSEGFEDPLGELYQQRISKGRNGQFFTPEHVASFMAALSINQDTPAGQAVCDTACGSGRMLLAAAKINRHLRFYGADIDPVCCKMSLVNLLLNSLSGEIAHMDSLSNRFHIGYKTGTVIVNGYHHPYFREFTDPDESSMWLRPPAEAKNGFDTPFVPPGRSPLMGGGVQGSLFEL